MKIIDIELHTVPVNRLGSWQFVRVHTNAGWTGLGEASDSGDDALLSAALEGVKQKIVGRDPRRIEAIRQQLQRINAGRVRQTAISAVDKALCDIVGQAADLPIRAFFGGAIRDRIPLYANLNRHLVGDRGTASFAEAAREAVREGFRAVKISPFDEVTGGGRIGSGPKASWRPGVERVRAVREAVGEDVGLAVDCHRRFELPEFPQVAAALAACNLLWLEEPVPSEWTEGLREARGNAGVTLAGGETLYGMEGFAPFLQRRVVDVLMPDVKQVGGVSELHRIAEAARLERLWVAPHNASGPVGTLAAAQVMSAASRFFILEYAWGEWDGRATLIDPPERIETGELVLPEGPGLGCRLNLETGGHVGT